MLHALHDDVGLHHGIGEAVSIAALKAGADEDVATFLRNEFLKVLLEDSDFDLLFALEDARQRFADRSRREGPPVVRVIHAGLAENISEAQHDKIERAVLADPERLRKSGTLEAMLHDERMFGTPAILRRPRT